MMTDTIFSPAFFCGGALGLGLWLGFWLRGYASKWDIDFWMDQWEHETKRADDLSAKLRKANGKLDRIRDVAAE